MNTCARVLIMDDHPLVREGLAARISTQPDLEVCGKASDVEEALALIHETRPAVTIVDLALRDSHGLDLIKQVRAEGLQTRMLVVSAYDESLYAERCIRAGAYGYVHKQELQEEVIAAIRAGLRGERYLSANLMRRLADRALDGDQGEGVVERLTDRELQIFELIGRGAGTRAIAEQLHVSIHTIETHRENIRAKLSLSTGRELMQHAVRWVLSNER
jgi:DNA-binding NarL/FixJ family response regulator